jgi:hypothetical protein
MTSPSKPQPPPPFPHPPYSSKANISVNINLAAFYVPKIPHLVALSSVCSMAGILLTNCLLKL